MTTRINKLNLFLIILVAAALAFGSGLAAYAAPVVAGGNGGFELDGGLFDDPTKTNAGGDSGEKTNNAGAMPSGWTAVGSTQDFAFGVSTNGSNPDSVTEHGSWHDPTIGGGGPNNDAGSGAFGGNYFGWMIQSAGGVRSMTTTATGLTDGDDYTTSMLYNVTLGALSPGAPVGNNSRDEAAFDILVDGNIVFSTAGPYVSSSGDNDYVTPFHSALSSTWTATGTSATIEIRPNNGVGADADAIIMLDDLVVTALASPGPGGGGAATPEPSTFALGVLAAVGLVFIAGRRRRRA